MRNRASKGKRSTYRRVPFGMLLMASFWILLTACSAKKPIANQELHRALATDDPPRSVAVLPFSDRSRTEGLAEMVRTSFYSHLSALPYKDIELDEVDARLKEHDLNSPEGIPPTAVKLLGRILAADAVVFGEVTEFDRVFAGLYSQLSVGAAITIYDTRSGRKLWQDEYVARFHEGGLPLDIISIPLIGMRSGLNLRTAVKLRAVDELCRELIGGFRRQNTGQAVRPGQRTTPTRCSPAPIWTNSWRSST